MKSITSFKLSRQQWNSNVQNLKKKTKTLKKKKKARGRATLIFSFLNFQFFGPKFF